MNGRWTHFARTPSPIHPYRGGQLGEQLLKVEAAPPGKVVERFEVPELRRPVLRLAVAPQHLPPTR